MEVTGRKITSVADSAHLPTRSTTYLNDVGCEVAGRIEAGDAQQPPQCRSGCAQFATAGMTSAKRVMSSGVGARALAAEVVSFRIIRSSSRVKRIALEVCRR